MMHGMWAGRLEFCVVNVGRVALAARERTQVARVQWRERVRGLGALNYYSMITATLTLTLTLTLTCLRTPSPL